MKPLAVRLLVFVALMFPVVSPAATVAQVNAWKAEFPAATASDSASLRKMIAGYQQLVNQATPTAKKILSLLKSKLIRDQGMTNKILHPAKPTARVTAAMRADAEEASTWLNGKFAPFLARAPQ